jgi:hypothetical protein
VKKPELIVTSAPDDDMLAGHCSSCPKTAQFRFRANNLRNRERMRRMFDTHFKRVHMREDASQAAANE